MQRPVLRRSRLGVAGRANRDWLRIRGVLVFFAIFLATVLPIAWLPQPYVAFGLMVAEAVDVAVVFAALAMVGGVGWTDLDPRRVRAVDWGLAAAAFAVLIPVNLGYHAVVLHLLGISGGHGLSDPFVTAGYGLVVQILAIAVQPGVIEELAFRGVIQTRIGTVVGRREALILTALAFGIIHLAWLSLPYLVLVGLTLGWLRNRSGSLLPGMALHAAHNLAVLLIEHART